VVSDNSFDYKGRVVILFRSAASNTKESHKKSQPRHSGMYQKDQVVSLSDVLCEKLR
jgi:hypothetical protein